MENRGVIRNRKMAIRIRDFSGLRFGKITPTDIDGFIEYQNRIFIFIEGKHRGVKMPFGQRLALERLCDACLSEGRKSYLFIVNYERGEDDIDYAASWVEQVRYGKAWHSPENPITLRDAIQKVLGITNKSCK